MIKIAVVGSGYVGLVAGACLADFGNGVVCVDKDGEKIKQLMNGTIPIYEPGLDELVKKNTHNRRLEFTTDLVKAVQSAQVIFIAVGTPPAEDGSADLQYVLEVAKGIGQNINEYKVIVDKSTVPVGTGEIVREIIQAEIVQRGECIPFDVVSNPEFLREGSAIYDFTHPDRIVLGVESERSERIMKDVYQPLYLNETPFVTTNIKSAELIKYASNAFLAMKITFINEIANLCEAVGADVHHVARGVGSDKRIGPKFLHPGPGYGGSCFPKDTRAIANLANAAGIPLTLVDQTISANEIQKMRMVRKITAALGEDLAGVTIAVLGITYKPNTDDMREAPSLTILPLLAERGAQLNVYDPEGVKEGSWRLDTIKDNIQFSANEYDASKDSDAVLILTEWNQFRNLDLNRIKMNMRGSAFFDLRNIYERQVVEKNGLEYYGVGR